MRRAAIYTRVSTDAQAVEGYSLDAQERSLTQRCAREGWSVYKVYTDAGISGKDLDRPAVNELLEDAKLRKFNIVLIWSLSRFTRSVADLYDTWNLLQENEISLISLTESFDTSTPTGRAMMGMLGVFAQMEREIIAERVRAALSERAKQGKRTCREVLGYDRDGNDSLRINPVEAEQVRYIFEQYIELKNISAVAELCRLRGYTGKRGGTQDSRILNILTRPVYAGYFSYKEEIHRGDFEPIISARTYNEVQRLLLNKKTGQPRKKKLFFLPEY